MTINEALRYKRYKLTPPDGGYGYVILVGTSVNLVTTTMFYVCFGVIFKEVFIKLGMGTMSISLLTGIRALSIALSGFVVGPLLKLVSRRKAAFIGCIFYNMGAFGTVFVDTQAQFFLCQGLLQTIGLGFLYHISVIQINDYFTEKRLLATSIMNTLAGAAGMVAPVVVSWSMAEYGSRGTLVIISAVAVHNFVGSALLQPVKWHMKKTVQEEEVFMKTNEADKTLLPARHEQLKDVDSGSSFTEDKTQTSGENFAKNVWLKSFLFLTGTLYLVAKECWKSKDYYREIPPMTQNTWKSIVDSSAIKNYMRTCAFYVVPPAMFADTLFIYNLAQSLYAENWNDEQVEWSFALVAFGDLATRIFFICSSTLVNLLGNRLIYLIGLLIAISTRLAMLWVRDYIGILVILSVMGISRCIIVVLLPLVIADSVQPEEFPSAIGISFAMFGFLGIVLGPVIGLIRDRTGSYTIMFTIIIAIFSVITVAWFMETLRHYRRKRTENYEPKWREIRSTSVCL